MWPFKSKVREEKKDLAQEAIDDFRAFRKIGQKFNYMGIDMIVESHAEFNLSGGVLPLLEAAYKDNNGVLRHAQFLRRELPALHAENPTSLGKSLV